MAKNKKLLVIKGGGSERFVVREEADAYAVGDEYDGGQLVYSEIVLPEDAERLEGLMAIDELESLILQALDSAYNRGRLDERTRISNRIERTLIGE